MQQRGPHHSKLYSRNSPLRQLWESTRSMERKMRNKNQGEPTTGRHQKRPLHHILPMTENSGHPTNRKLKILQYNLAKGRETTDSVLSDDSIKQFTVLVLQEQCWSTFLDLSLPHQSWTLLEPTLTLSFCHYTLTIIPSGND